MERRNATGGWFQGLVGEFHPLVQTSLSGTDPQCRSGFSENGNGWMMQKFILTWLDVPALFTNYPPHPTKVSLRRAASTTSSRAPRRADRTKPTEIPCL